MVKFPKDKEQMVVENMGLVEKIARLMSYKYRSPLVGFDDFVQVGSIGLMRAVETFDESKGFQFSTFAHWTILGFIIRELNKSTPIRAPVHIVSLARLIHKRGQQEDSPQELAEFYRCAVANIESALYYLIFDVVPVDANIDDDETFHSFHGTEDDSSGVIVKEFMDTLKPNHLAILDGLMAGKTFVDISVERGVSKQAIEQTMPIIRKRWIEFESGERTQIRKGRPPKELNP